MTIAAIDVWAQRPTNRFLREPWLATLNRWTGKDGEARQQVSVEEILAHMNEANVAQALLCAWCGPKGWLITNEEVAEQVNRHPNRFVGVASVDLFQPMKAIHELRRFVRDHDFKALRIVPWLWGLPPDDRRYYPLYALCVELDIPFMTQIGHTGPLLSSEPGRPIPYLENVLLDFPELKVIGGHVGFPWMNEVLTLAYKFKNFYIDTSAYSAKRYPRELIEYLQGPGKDRVMFGTNYPMLTPKQALEALDALSLTDAGKSAFLRDNAARVLKLDSKATMEEL